MTLEKRIQVQFPYTELTHDQANQLVKCPSTALETHIRNTHTQTHTHTPVICVIPGFTRSMDQELILTTTAC